MVMQRLRKMTAQEADKSTLQATARTIDAEMRFKKAGKQVLLQPIDHDTKHKKVPPENQEALLDLGLIIVPYPTALRQTQHL